MNLNLMVYFRAILMLVICFSFNSFRVSSTEQAAFKFPYLQAGLTEREAIAHLLNRFTFGATNSEIEKVLAIGPENWFAQQLGKPLPDEELQSRLKDFEFLNLTNKEVNTIFPTPGQLAKIAASSGLILKDSATDIEKAQYKKEVATLFKANRYRRPEELAKEFISAKILRATYSNNQLHEVMVDFWFNHFNVSFSQRDCFLYIPAYERDVIRPNALGKFNNLLLATAKSPAMLLYLDNFNSVADDEHRPNSIRSPLRQTRMDKVFAKGDTVMQEKIKQRKKGRGLNENYARELMELHTLGVDGGYSQEDVTQAAMILTGWTLYPMKNGYGNALLNVIEKIGEENLVNRGFVHDGDFLFAMNNHDTREKKVLGKTFSNAGYSEGESLLGILATHNSTANFISRKIAVRFVSDDPPQSLIDKMAKTFLNKKGDISEVLITMVSSPEFWSKSVIRSKTKSPFEMTISTARVLNADIQQPYQMFRWMDKMGQRIYYYNAPTGFPDKAEYWINTGALLNRMNFGLAMANQQVRGVKVDLLALNQNHEPESSSSALLTYGQLIMPERDLTSTIKRLTPILNQPLLEKKVEAVAVKKMAQRPTVDIEDEMMDNPSIGKNKPQRKVEDGNMAMLAQVVGIIIGSPEFQRR